MAVLLALLVPLLGVVLYSYPPTESSYYPRCLLHQLTGWHCAGCGTARALHALLHGQIGQALGYNALLVLALPFLIVWGLVRWWNALLERNTPLWRPPVWSVAAFAVLILAYSVVRNVPCYPFTLLAPPLMAEPAARPAQGDSAEGEGGGLGGWSSRTESFTSRKSSPAPKN
jgi:hypothetical protein